jgi:NAD(P)-dependent dehydrogenase (short-subunit alcohol dehydrogenase family)
MPNDFNETSTADDVLQGLDLSGTHALITGASGGLGAETGRALASAGARVTLAARDLAKVEAVAEEIRSGGNGREVDVTVLELTSLDSVRDCAKRFLSRYDQLDILINNAGVMACDLTRTPNGWELQMATNHIGHFLLTCKLIPALQGGGSARIINLSSAGHRLGGMDFDDPHFEERDYDKWLAYGQSKTANILFTLELDRRLAGSGVRSIAVHPGMIMTELGRHLTQQDVEDLMSRADPASGRPTFKSVEQGAATTTWAASSPELEDLGGFYCENCNIASEKVGEDSTTGISSHALDGEAARRLWTLSENWVGESFSLT